MEGSWAKILPFTTLTITTVTSSLLLASTCGDWTESGRLYRAVTSYRASTQLAVQIISYLLGLIQVSAVCCLIHYNTRLLIQQSSASLDMIHLWTNLSALRIGWTERLRYLLPVLVFVSATSIPAGLWAGAITPVSTSALQNATINLPAYNDVSLIKEYPTQIDALGPILRDRQGLFAYSVAMKYLGQLLSSAASATVPDNSTRQHAKFDNTGYTYFGRSYGVASSVGLQDAFSYDSDLGISFSYLETGYETSVNCQYNDSSQFIIETTDTDLISQAVGNLPDSVNGAEYSRYFGDSNAIVAIGVAHDIASERRFAAIAAGSSYSFLDKIQCAFEFNPTQFNVSVHLLGRNITVVPVSSDVSDIDPGEGLRKTAVIQLALLANDQTNMYVSLVGDSLNSSIANWEAIANQDSTPSDSLGSLRDAALAGVANSFTAMMDDMLMCYAGAQFMIAKDTQSAAAVVKISALRFGQKGYIYTIFVLNCIVVLAVALDAVRTRCWRGLTDFDYLDPRRVIIAASRGGSDLADQASRLPLAKSAEKGAPAWRARQGQLRVRLKPGIEPSLVLDTGMPGSHP